MVKITFCVTYCVNFVQLIQFLFLFCLLLLVSLHVCCFLPPQVNKMCQVIYRKLEFENYPDHVKQLRTYAFKPLILQVNKTFSSLFYVIWDKTLQPQQLVDTKQNYDKTKQKLLCYWAGFSLGWVVGIWQAICLITLYIV